MQNEIALVRSEKEQWKLVNDFFTENDIKRALEEAGIDVSAIGDFEQADFIARLHDKEMARLEEFLKKIPYLLWFSSGISLNCSQEVSRRVAGKDLLTQLLQDLPRCYDKQIEDFKVTYNRGCLKFYIFYQGGEEDLFKIYAISKRGEQLGWEYFKDPKRIKRYAYNTKAIRLGTYRV